MLSSYSALHFCVCWLQGNELRRMNAHGADSLHTNALIAADFKHLQEWMSQKFMPVISIEG